MAIFAILGAIPIETGKDIALWWVERCESYLSGVIEQQHLVDVSATVKSKARVCGVMVWGNGIFFGFVACLPP